MRARKERVGADGNPKNNGNNFDIEGQGSGGKPQKRGNKGASHNEEDIEMMEDSLIRDNNQHIEALSGHVSMIKSITQGIRNQMSQEQTILTQIDDKFGETGKKVKGVFQRMDDVLEKASRSFFCYFVLFTLLIVGILIKLS
uniref:t-SNARE coiled-coil homology domain-containing protein n=1 Tax=Strombidium rassoulzadegani TaxID=1082188 RepID=A0A7S3FWM0_9SPIT|mmetsp:Transcript_14769/g.25128  ORF Transcript_14769/g.25128 Transcript_14769/m.25128 type:complete len:142 (+) Transcript_14769:51-476(+)